MLTHYLAMHMPELLRGLCRRCWELRPCLCPPPSSPPHSLVSRGLGEQVRATYHGVVIDIEMSGGRRPELQGALRNVPECAIVPDRSADVRPACFRQAKQRSKRDASRLPPGAVKVPHNINTLVCELCGGGHHEEKIILCDACDRGCHMFCLDPPMFMVPRGEWVCPLCTADEAAAGNAFQEGDETTLASFEQAAASFKSGWWGDEVRRMCRPPASISLTDSCAPRASERHSQLLLMSCGVQHQSAITALNLCWPAHHSLGSVQRWLCNAWQEPTMRDVESEFWRIVEDGDEAVEVLAGMDLDSTEYGSGFPTGSDLLDGAQACHRQLVSDVCIVRGSWPFSRSMVRRRDSLSLRRLACAGVFVQKTWLRLSGRVQKLA